jgi:hypothetical protein
MKKVVTIIAIAGAFAFVACGPSAAEKEKAQKMKDSLTKDSTDKAAQKAADAMKKHDDSMKAAAAMKDSTKKDSAAKK